MEENDMSNRLDFYYNPDQAAEFAEFNDHCNKGEEKVRKLFKGKEYTEAVPENELPSRGCAESTFIGTGTIDETHDSGVW